MSEIELVWDPQCDVAESPVWDDARRSIFFRASIGREPLGRICAYGVDDGSQRTWELPEQIGSLGLCESGRLIVACATRLVFFDPSTGAVEEFTGEIEASPNTRFNDGRPGPDGSFWVGMRDMRPGTDFEPEGTIWRITPEGTAECKLEGIYSPNGLAFGPGGGTFFYGDTRGEFIEAWDFSPATGEISNRRRVTDTPVATGRPDGGATSADGHYWSAGVTAGALNEYAPSGELLRQIPTPCAGPTMPCFADDLLFLTSRVGLADGSAPELSERPHNVGALFKMPAPTTGAPVDVFAGH